MLYNAPVFAASAVNVMAAQSVSIDKYPKGEQQVGDREIFGFGTWRPEHKPAPSALLYTCLLKIIIHNSVLQQQHGNVSGYNSQ